ncbi:hypothetical protein [Okeania sp. SIO2C2]|nr:hypothetical protein [Okeania sp. SIO2C2]
MAFIFFLLHRNKEHGDRSQLIQKSKVTKVKKLAIVGAGSTLN